MVPDVVSVYFGLFRNTVESLSGSNCRLLASVLKVRREQTNVPLYFGKPKKKIFKIRIHKGGARLVLNSYVDVNLRKIVHVSLFFLKVSYAPTLSFLVAMCFCILIACIRIKENMTLKCHE